MLGRAGGLSNMIFLQEKMDPVPLAEGHLFFTGLCQGLGRRREVPVPEIHLNCRIVAPLHPALGTALRHGQVAASFFLSTRGQSLGFLLIIW